MIITNCTIEGNTAKDSGGGIHCTSSLFIDTESLTITNCTIEGNTANEFGGGVYSLRPSYITMCVINHNLSKYGGGIATSAVDTKLIQCIIDGNSSSVSGGGVYGYLSFFLIDCKIRNNHSDEGAGVYAGGSPDISGCFITENSASSSGGGVSFVNGYTKKIANCFLSENSAPNGSALRCSSYSSIIFVVNCTFKHNHTSNGKGVVDCIDNSDLSIVNTIFSGNTGHAIYEYNANFDIKVTSCLFYNNPDGDYYDEGALSFTGAANINSKVRDASGNVDGDPKLTSDGQPGPGSMAIDRGTGEGAPSTDILGNPRPIDFPGYGAEATGAEYDIGAYEVQLASADPILTVPDVPLDFGQVGTNPEQPKKLSLTLRNDGFTSLTFTGQGATISGPGAADFSLDGPFDLTPLAPGSQRALPLAFAPHNPGPTSATLTLTSNDPQHPSLEIVLRGEGVQPTPILTVLNAPLDFGQVAQDAAQPVNKSLTLRNDGSGALIFTSPGATISGPGAADFSLASPFNLMPLAPASQRSLSIAFDPHNPGPTSATLTITTNDPQHPSMDVILQGYGTLPAPNLTSLPAYTAGNSATIQWPAVEGAHQYIIQSSLSSSFSSARTTDHVFADTLSILFNGLSDGTKYWFRVCAVNAVGIAGAWSSSASTTMDSTPPTGSININNNVLFTNSRDVGLQLEGYDNIPGLNSMRLSNDGKNWSAWESFSANKEWKLSAGDGNKTVYVQYRDLAGLESEQVGASIGLDQTPPVASQPKPDVVVATLSHATFTWDAATDPAPGSGVAMYDYQIGTAPGASDVNSGNVGASLSKYFAGIFWQNPFTAECGLLTGQAMSAHGRLARPGFSLIRCPVSPRSQSAPPRHTRWKKLQPWFRPVIRIRAIPSPGTATSGRTAP